ncbi:oligouridylate-binding protein 1-like protein, partial [Tanacetum coccineum]
AKGAASDDKPRSDTQSVVELTNGTSGNLALDVIVTSVHLHCHFHALGVGVIQDARIQPDKGFGFIIYTSHVESAHDI